MKYPWINLTGSGVLINVLNGVTQDDSVKNYFLNYFLNLIKLN
jgi:hypothetical protein